MDKNLFKQYCPNPKTILEAGCHDGRDTIQMATMFPNAMIYGFEPVPRLFEILQNKTKPYTNVKIFNHGLYNYNGSGEFYVSSGKGDASSSARKPKDHLKIHPQILFEKKDKIIVEFLTIDEWAKQNNISLIDIMWLDMQGVEKETLEASPNILKTVKVIHSEISIEELYDGLCLYDDYKKWMASNGLYVVAENMGDRDALFVRK